MQMLEMELIITMLLLEGERRRVDKDKVSLLERKLVVERLVDNAGHLVTQLHNSSGKV